MSRLRHAFCLLFVGLATGCEPSCEDTCEKLLACDQIEMEHTSARECAAACETQQGVYDKWKSTDEREWFADMKYCIDDASCSEIADGECYDDELYIW